MLLVAGCVGSGSVLQVQPVSKTATVLEARTEPLDLDHNGRFEWRLVKFQLPLPESGRYNVVGTVSIPTRTGS